MGKIVFVSLGMLIGGSASVSDMSGPVGVVDAMNTTAQTGGFIGLLSFAAFISVNIGIMNLLPIPGLDGSRLLFLVLLKTAGKILEHRHLLILFLSRELIHIADPALLILDDLSLKQILLRFYHHVDQRTLSGTVASDKPTVLSVFQCK